jgi:predicted nucleic acid-binding protein
VKSSGTIVDTSIWIDFLRGVPWVKKLLERPIAEDRVFIAGPILFELLQGIRSPKERKQVQEALLSMKYLQISADDWAEAGTLSSELRAQGITIPMTDLLIAQLAKRYDLLVISFDTHFDQVPGLRCERPAP